METSQFLTQNKAAEFLGINIQTLRKYKRKGIFNPIELPQLILYPIHELEDFKESYQVRQGKKLSQK